MNLIITFLPVILITFFILVFAVALPLRNKKINSKFVVYYKGIENYLLGDITFFYGNMRARISRIANGGGGYSNYNGYYVQFWTYVNSRDKLIIGHPKSGRYTRGKFLVLPPHKNIDLTSLQVLFGTDNPALMDKIQKNSDNKKFDDACAHLFSKEFNHLTISSEIHFDKFLPSKKYVLKYSPIPGSIFSNPENLKPYMDSIAEVCSILNVDFETN
jgi:hypothetical protein